jgi:hypothetical protein
MQAVIATDCAPVYGDECFEVILVFLKFQPKLGWHFLYLKLQPKLGWHLIIRRKTVYYIHIGAN